MLRLTLPIVLLTFSVLSACQSSPTRVTLRDSQGNFVTTADFEAMDRTEFVKAIEAGLADYDSQMVELRARANELGGDALSNFAEREMDLRAERTEVVNQLSIAQNAMNEQWPSERADTVEAYADLREELADAQKDVLDR